MSDPATVIMEVAATVAVSRPREERRQIGAFYTPAVLSQMLADWAIRLPTDTVLEPSFGGCGFLASARTRLNDVGATTPEALIFGCDTDPVAFDYLTGDLAGWDPAGRLVLRDFLECRDIPGWPAKFQTVLANPPYIRHQNLGNAAREKIANWSGAIPGVGGRAGLWAYFISHAIGLLEVGGRMAWVLPGALMQADYARPIRNFFAKRFDRCAAFVVHERLFLEEGTDEETVIILADGLREDEREDGRLDVDDATTLTELQALITRWDVGDWEGTGHESRPALIGWPEDARSLYDRLDAHATPLGALASVSIGLVTGANDFFVLSRSRAIEVGLTEQDLEPVLPKFIAAPGGRFTAADHSAYLDKGSKAWLVSSRGRESNPRITAYLQTFDPERKKDVSTFKKRACWSETSDGKLPDAFLPVMHHAGPRLVLNELGCSSTNTVHRVTFNDTLPPERRMLACLSMMTTFSQISGEIVGRRYGSGVLKHEPRDAEGIRLLMPDLSRDVIEATFEAVDKALRENDVTTAMALADKVICGAVDSKVLKTLSLLRSTLTGIRTRRRPERRRRGR